MESRIVHQHLNDNTPDARDMLICYLQYLMDYRRDVPQKEEHIIYELQGLLSTTYTKLLEEDDVMHRLLHTAQELEPGDDENNKAIWSALKSDIALLG